VVLETLTSGPVLAAVDGIAGLQGVQTRTASLEDVYLALTGAQAPGQQPQAQPPA
ncbi:ABC transporter ATP-binding protein, partial [Streptomyces rubiginosohelvolus]